MKEYGYHEYADIFPMISGDDLQALADDIKKNGLHRPVIVHDDKILDGRNRYQACKLAGIDATFELYSGDDPLGFIISENLHRRHLNESQRAMVAAKIANLGEGRPDKTASIDAVSQIKAAQLLNVSRASVQRAKEVIRKAPEKVKEVEQGNKTLHRAKQEIKLKEVKEKAPPVVAEEPSHFINVDHVDELVKEMYGTILRRFRKLNNKQYNRAVNNLIKLLQKYER